MSRTKKPTNDFAVAAAALKDLNRLDGAAPKKRRCPPGTTTDPFNSERLVPLRPQTIGAMLANDRQRRTPAPITLPEVTALTLSEDDIHLDTVNWEEIRAVRALHAHRKTS